MTKFKKFAILFISILILAMGTAAYISFYSYIFSRKVIGVIENVERVEMNVALLQPADSGQLNKQIFSFAVAIKESNGEIVTASAEDRQWAVSKVGQCAEAIYYPYPPWKLDKAGTYYGARLTKLSDCSQGK